MYSKHSLKSREKKSKSDYICNIQGFPQEKIIAGRSVFIAGHTAIFIFSIVPYIFNLLMDIIADQSGIKAGWYSR